MGIKSTFDIDRQTAIIVILGKINFCTNEQLACMLENFNESEFRNYIVYNELPECIDRKYDKVIDNCQDFNTAL